jgi:hypothetical protein
MSQNNILNTPDSRRDKRKKGGRTKKGVEVAAHHSIVPALRVHDSIRESSSQDTIVEDPKAAGIAKAEKDKAEYKEKYLKITNIKPVEEPGDVIIEHVNGSRINLSAQKRAEERLKPRQPIAPIADDKQVASPEDIVEELLLGPMPMPKHWHPKSNGGLLGFRFLNCGIYDTVYDYLFFRQVEDDYGYIVEHLDNPPDIDGIKTFSCDDIVGRGKFISELANSAKADIPGILKNTEATNLVVKRYMVRMMTERNVRKSHQAIILPLAMLAARTPNSAEVIAAASEGSRAFVERNAMYHNRGYFHRGDRRWFNWFGVRSKPVGPPSAL